MNKRSQSESISSEQRTERMMAMFFRALKGEALSAKSLAYEYGVSNRSISRDISTLKAFLADHRDVLDNAELVYSGRDHCYRLTMDSIISNKELLAVAKVLIGCRAFSSKELIAIVAKLKSHTSIGDRAVLENLIRKELFHYSEIHFDCTSLIDNIWTLTECIEKKRLISIEYYRMDRTLVSHRLCPASIMFSDYYFYLIAYMADGDTIGCDPTYFRIDRIISTVMHRDTFKANSSREFDEGLLRKRSLLMWPGRLRHIQFEFCGPSVQAILDKIPTAHITDITGSIYVIDADVYGDGIKMFLLSQGSWVHVLSPFEFVEEMQDEIEKMIKLYQKPEPFSK